MPIAKIQGSQRDFSAGELDVAMKRADENPVMKAGLRQAANARILNSKAIQNRPGRRALFKETGRVEEVLMSPGNTFYLVFGTTYLRVYNAAGAQVFSSSKKGDGSTNISWGSTLGGIVWALASGAQLSIYIAYSATPTNVPQILTWDGVSQTSTWTLSTYAESIDGSLAKQTFFYRISTLGIAIGLSGSTGSVTATASAPLFTAGMIGTRLRYVTDGQLLITAVADSTHATVTCSGYVHHGVRVAFGSDPVGLFAIGDLVTGSVTSAQGLVTGVDNAANSIDVQHLDGRQFTAGDTIVSSFNSLAATGLTDLPPQSVAIWDDEVMNALQGYPKSVFFDQNRLGFCNFPPVPSGIGWSAIGRPTDLAIGATPDDAMLELSPGKSQVLYVLAGMESSEFVFCDDAIYYIPITPTNPLKPGSVAFNQLSQQGVQAHIEPRTAEQTIVYVKSGGTQIGAVQAPGSYYRPYTVDDISDLHGHLLNSPIAIAIPTGSAQFEEDYIYVLNTDGTVAVGKYSMKNGLIDGGPDGKPHVGWVPWSGVGTVGWVAGLGSDAIFTTAYGAASVVEALDNTQYLDAALLVNSLPTPFVTGGKGPLYAFPGPGATVTLIDQGYRMMGTYTIDANGFIIPQGNGGENLAAATLMAGQPWTMTIEPFVPDAPPGGQDVHQRMMPRRVSRFAAYVSNSTGFVIGRLFSGKLRPGGPALGTLMNFRRIPAWNQDDDATKPPPLREQAERARPIGRSYDPRIAVIKDTPGPLLIHEFAMEATI